jgi:hypothetical protein
MKNIILATILFVISVISGSCITRRAIHDDTKTKAAYVGVAAEVQQYVDEYFKLSAENGLVFTHKVTIGMTTIKRASIIGLCTYGDTFREIDLDIGFMRSEPEIRKRALVFHEMTHCYCDRRHDYDNGAEYPASPLQNIFTHFKVKIGQQIPWCLDKNVPGYLEDGCPKSIMHPFILSELCLKNHQDYYIKEMFARCKPY